MRFVLLVLAIATLSFLREPGGYLSPILAYEDGRDVFAFYYNHPEPGSILRSYNGYVSFLPNLWGWLVMRGPVELAPYLLAGGPLLLSSLAFAFFALPIFRPFVPSDRARAGIALVAAAAPLTNYLYLGNTMYSVWSLLVLLVLAALAPTPRTVAGTVAAGTGQALAIVSHPLSLLVAPVYLARAFAEARLGFEPRPRPRLARAYFLALTGAAALYQVAGVSREAVSSPGLGDTLYLTYRFLLERVVFGTLFGDGAARALRRAGHEGWIAGLALAVLAILAVALWLARRRFGRIERFAGLYLAWIVVGLTTLYVIGRSPDLSILGSDRAFRYFWTQRVLFVILLGALGHRLLSPMLAGRPWGVKLVPLVLVAAALVALHRDNLSPYRVRPAQGAEVRAFTAEIARLETAHGGRRDVSARLERGPWTLEIDR